MKIIVWDIVAAFFAAALSGMGVGGGGLFVVYLTLARDVGQYDAQRINLFFFIAASGASLIIHFLRRKINFLAFLIFAVMGSVGAIAGSLIAARVSGGALRYIFGAFLITCSIISLFKGSKKAGAHEK